MQAHSVSATRDAVSRRPVLLYDGGCRLCRWAARVAAALDRRGRLALLSLAEPEADELLGSISPDQRRECWWLVLHDGTPVPGDRGGGVLLLGKLGRLRPVGRLLGALGASPLVDALDRVVSRHRGRLGRYVPDGHAPRRYP